MSLMSTPEPAPDPFPIHIRRPRSRHRTVSVTNLTFDLAVDPQRPQSRRQTYTVQRFLKETPNRLDSVPLPLCQGLPPLPPKPNRCLTQSPKTESWKDIVLPLSGIPKERQLTRSVSMETVQASSRYLTDLEWRMCHAVNIYIYKNGVENQSPMLVHIPPAMKVGMKRVLEVLNDRVKYGVGYAKAVYKMDGSKVTHPCELEMYNNYVVASNQDKHFKCVQYGRRRSPLLVLSPLSKHARAMRDQRDRLRCCLMKKSSSDDLGYVCPRASMEVVGGIGCCKPGEIGPVPEQRKVDTDAALAASRIRSKSKDKIVSTSSVCQPLCHSLSPNPISMAPMTINMLTDVRLDAMGGPYTNNDTKVGGGHVAINLSDVKGDENNNLVDAIIALQRSEHKFPPLSTATGRSSVYKQASTVKIGNTVTQPMVKSRGYSESDFEADDSYEETEGEPDPKPWASVGSVSRSRPSRHSDAILSDRPHTYTIQYHMEIPTNLNLPLIGHRAEKSTSTSSLQRQARSGHQVGCGTDSVTRPEPRNLMPSPPSSPSHDIRYNPSHALDLRRLDPEDDQYDRETYIESRGFTPGFSEDEMSLTFDLDPNEEFSYENNNYPLPPLGFRDSSSPPTLDWLTRPETRSYPTYHLTTDPIRTHPPPPSEFGTTVCPSPRRRTVQFMPPPTSFADEFRESTRARSKVRVRPQVTLRPRPTFAYPVEDYIFKNGIRFPLNQTVKRHVVHRRQTVSKGKGRCGR